MLSPGILSLVEEQLDLNNWEINMLVSHPVDFGFYVSSGKVEFINGGFTFFQKTHGGILINVECMSMYPDIICTLEKTPLRPEFAEIVALCEEILKRNK